jgi:hypothetical protein
MKWDWQMWVQFWFLVAQGILLVLSWYLIIKA